MEQYLGLDSSTQGLKAVIIGSCGVIAEESVHFGSDLPEFHSPNGFLRNEDPEVVHADPLMWLAALDLLFAGMKKRGIRLDRIRGISGSGQQHGSVYLKACFGSLLSALDPEKTLAEQLSPALARRTAPIWMDHSTGRQCKALKDRFGKLLQVRTGSAAAERFTGPQIMKFAQEEPDAWRQTAHIHLVSSFLASVLCGKNAPIDCGDGAGMNLLNLQTLQWDAEIAEFTAPGLTGKLPVIAGQGALAGTLSPYFCKYGFAADVPVAVWSGDNPCSLVGTGCAEPGTIGISLGTSDTLFSPMRDFRTDPAGCGHIFGNPAGGFLSLICFANGSLARERLREKFGFSREEWEAAVQRTAPASGKIMLPYFEPECTPPIADPHICCNFDEAADPAATVRALLETQILSMKHHSGWMGIPVRKIRVTGGASRSAGLCRIIADIFQADVEQSGSTNAAGIGAAMCAANAVGKIPFSVLSETFCKAENVIRPVPGNVELYQKQEKGFADFLKKCYP